MPRLWHDAPAHTHARGGGRGPPHAMNGVGMTTARVHSPGELLAAIPHLLGFTPTESIVVVGVMRARHLGMIMRIDRADCLIPEIARDLGQAIGAHLEQDGASFALIVGYSSEPLDQPCEALAQVAPWIDDYVPVRDEWRVGEGRYRSAACTDISCCPVRGLPLPHFDAEADIVRLRDSLRAALRSASGDPQAPLGLVPTVDPERRRRAARARDRAWKARDRNPHAWAHDTFELWRAHVAGAMDGHMPSDAECGRLLAGLRDVHVRDAAIIDLNTRYAHAAEDLASGKDTEEIAMALRGLLTSPPAGEDSAKAEAAAELAALLAGYAWGRTGALDAASPLSIAALARKWRGEDLLARALIQRALDADPHYSLAHLVASLFSVGAATR